MTAALPDAHVGDSLGVAAELHDLLDVNPARHRSNPPRETPTAAVPDRTRDQRQYRQCCHARGESAKHDHRTFFTYSVFAIFPGARTDSYCRPRDQLYHLAYWFSKRSTSSDNRAGTSPCPKA